MPLWLILIPYAIFLLVFLVFSIIDIANAWRFRSGFISSSFLIFVYLTGCAIILVGTYLVLSPIDWMQVVGFGTTSTLTL